MIDEKKHEEKEIEIDEKPKTKKIKQEENAEITLAKHEGFFAGINYHKGEINKALESLKEKDQTEKDKKEKQEKKKEKDEIKNEEKTNGESNGESNEESNGKSDRGKSGFGFFS